MLTTYEKLEEHVSTHAETVGPGCAYTMTNALSVGDVVAQGDLHVSLIESVPYGYAPVKPLIDSDRQLVPESGAGSHHRVKSITAVRIYRRPDWGKSMADLRGPVVEFLAPNEIVHEPGHEHPHGTIIIAEPMLVECRYQRDLTIDGLQARQLD